MHTRMNGCFPVDCLRRLTLHDVVQCTWPASWCHVVMLLPDILSGGIAGVLLHAEHGVIPLGADQATRVWVRRPRHVQVGDIVVYATNQSGPQSVARVLLDKRTE